MPKILQKIKGALENALEKKKSAPYNTEAVHRNRHNRAKLHAEMKQYRINK